MKKMLILFLLAAIALTGCMTMTGDIEPNKSIVILDFTKYNDAGFLITPEKPEGKYNSLGMINSWLKGGARITEETVKDAEGNSCKRKKYIAEDVDIYTLLDSVYEQAASMGGDALVNFGYTLNPITIPIDIPPYSVYVTEIYITGFIIDRVEE